jgi:hypothetical protein
MTFVQLYGEALDIELATADRTQLFTTTRRKKAINDAQDAFARLTGCSKRYGAALLPDGVDATEYVVNLEGASPDFIRLVGAPSIKIVDGTDVHYIQGREDFPRHDQEELDRINPGWLSAPAGTPSSWYIKEDSALTEIGLTPPPDVVSPKVWFLNFPYVADPPDMSADADEPYTFGGTVTKHLRFYHQGLVHYAAAQLEPLRKNYSGVTRQMQLYTGYVASFLQQQRQDGPDQITTARDYYSESVRGGSGAQDPRSWP